jgi:CTP:molybdopterin cytidylyltransferase MocA
MKFAVLLAGGQSKRMGRPKLVLPLGERTVLEHVLAALRQAAVEHILVVIGPHVAELGALAESAGA